MAKTRGATVVGNSSDTTSNQGHENKDFVTADGASLGKLETYVKSMNYLENDAELGR
jgi:hypothetical protein